MYYPSSENKGADQLRGYREADLRLCFRLGKNPVFSRCGSGIVIDGFVIGKDPLVIKFLTGVYNMRPPKCRYVEIWDVKYVTDFLKSLPAVDKLSLKLLTYNSQGQNLNRL